MKWVSKSNSDITLHGTPDEVASIEAMLTGTAWICSDQENGMVRRERFIAPPRPVDDPDIPPRWVSSFGAVKTDPRMVSQIPPDEGWHHPSFILSGVAPLRSSDAEYPQEVVKLQSYGFECLRSRRARDGKYWELWYLPGSWAAKGDLKDHTATLKGVAWHVESESIVRFLMKHVRFGSLDVMVQRAALVIDD